MVTILSIILLLALIYWFVIKPQPPHIAKYMRTKNFVGRQYKINNPEKKVITAGDVVIVHPTETSKSRVPYEAKIVLKKIDWSVIQGDKIMTKPSLELCTFVENGYAAVINEYLFSRLQPKLTKPKFPVKPEDCKKHKVVGFDGISDICAECGERIPFIKRTFPLEDYFSKEYVVSYKHKA